MNNSSQCFLISLLALDDWSETTSSCKCLQLGANKLIQNVGNKKSSTVYPNVLFLSETVGLSFPRDEGRENSPGHHLHFHVGIRIFVGNLWFHLQMQVYMPVAFV